MVSTSRLSLVLKANGCCKPLTLHPVPISGSNFPRFRNLASFEVLLIWRTEPFHGYNPKKKDFNQEIELIHDLEPIEAIQSEADSSGMGPVVVREVQERHPHLHPQGILLQPLGWRTDPNCWDAGGYRIPTDIIAQMGRATLGLGVHRRGLEHVWYH